MASATSTAADFTSGTFRPVIPDTTVDGAGVTRVLLCSGKVYYDLLAERQCDGVVALAVHHPSAFVRLRR